MENKSAFLKKIGENIKYIRKAKKLEVKEVAPGLGISPQAYGAIENGKVDLNITRVFEIANYFSVDFSEFLNLKEGDIFNFTSQNNSGGYHVQSVGVLNVSDENIRSYLQEDISQIKQKIFFFEEALKKQHNGG